MTDCREFCRAAPTCEPCAHDAELSRVSATYRVTREGSNPDGSLWADLDGLPLHGTRRLVPDDWCGRVLADED